METNLTGRELDWNDVIEHDSEFVLLPEGDYDFTVKRVERGRHAGSAKLPPCNKAVLEIEVTDGRNRATVTHNLFLHSKCEGLLCEFFASIGLRKRGEPLHMDWNRVPGASGRCKVIVDSFTSRNTGEEMKSNKIRRFYAREDGAPANVSSVPGTAGGTGGGFRSGGFAGGFKR